MYILTCPNCGSQEIEETECEHFECKCGTEFELKDACYDED